MAQEDEPSWYKGKRKRFEPYVPPREPQKPVRGPLDELEGVGGSIDNSEFGKEITSKMITSLIRLRDEGRIPHSDDEIEKIARDFASTVLRDELLLKKMRGSINEQNEAVSVAMERVRRREDESFMGRARAGNVTRDWEALQPAKAGMRWKKPGKRRR